MFVFVHVDVCCIVILLIMPASSACVNIRVYVRQLDVCLYLHVRMFVVFLPASMGGFFRADFEGVYLCVFL